MKFNIQNFDSGIFWCSIFLKYELEQLDIILYTWPSNLRETVWNLEICEIIKGILQGCQKRWSRVTELTNLNHRRIKLGMRLHNYVSTIFCRRENSKHEIQYGKVEWWLKNCGTWLENKKPAYTTCLCLYINKVVSLWKPHASFRSFQFFF